MRRADACDAEAWVRRVNRWIVHRGLDDRAEEWLQELAREDDGRLRRSCELARRMTRRVADDEDPKPWFYAGLFGLATRGEAGRFLARHHLTAAVLPVTDGDPDLEAWERGLAPETRDLVAAVREGLRRELAALSEKAR